MSKQRLAIIVLDDEPEVREALEQDLAPLAQTVRIEPAEDAEDAWAVIKEIEDDGDLLAVVLADHRMPGTTGVDFLVELVAQESTADTRTILITGQADHKDTIKAINEAGLAHYIPKPWNVSDLLDVVRTELTTYVEIMQLDPIPHLAALDQVRAMDLISG